MNLIMLNEPQILAALIDLHVRNPGLQDDEFRMYAELGIEESPIMHRAVATSLAAGEAAFVVWLMRNGFRDAAERFFGDLLSADEDRTPAELQ